MKSSIDGFAVPTLVDWSDLTWWISNEELEGGESMA
jgi:hypothetical protein